MVRTHNLGKIHVFGISYGSTNLPIFIEIEKAKLSVYFHRGKTAQFFDT